MASNNGTGLLVVWTDVAPEYEAEFNEWYDKEHIPQLLGVPGFLSGTRYQAVDGKPKYAAIYDLTDESVTKSPAFLKVRNNPTPWTAKMLPHFQNTQRGVFRQILAHGTRPAKDAEFVLTVRLNTPAEHEKDFNVWYDEDHIPALVGVPGVYCARRFVRVEDDELALKGDQKYLAVYEMRDGGIPKTPEWNTARNYGRTAQIRPHLKDMAGVVAKRIFPA
jgi:hypothetical protein